MSFGITTATVSVVTASLLWNRWTSSQDTEVKFATQQALVAVLEKQLERCGPEHLHCPPARDLCSYTQIFLAFFAGACIGFLVGIVVFIGVWFRYRSPGQQVELHRQEPAQARVEGEDRPVVVAAGRLGRRERGVHLALSDGQLTDLGY